MPFSALKLCVKFIRIQCLEERGLGDLAMRGLAALMIAAATLAPAASADTKAIGRYKDWRVYTEGEGRNMICFAAVEPSDKAPKNVEHGEVTFYVASWKSGASANQPSLKVGYTLRKDLAPEAIIGRERFSMYAVGPEAFASDNKDSALVAALKKGSELRVEAASVKDARTAYHFSLKGSTEAIDKARSLCR
jgi:invasion protein IalB